MKVGIISYPGLWQRNGGLQIQIEKTCTALRELGVELKVVDFVNEKISSYDIIHSFSAAHGLYSVIEEAKAQGVKVVVSPILQPELHVSKFRLYHLLDWITGQLSSREVRTTYGQIKSVLNNADMILALSQKEKKVINEGYRIDAEKIAVIPNGIDEFFFNKTAIGLPSNLEQLKDYVFISGSISEYKNQLGVINATDLPVILAGPCYSVEYLNKCLQTGGGRVHYVGALEHSNPLLASLYAHASVNVLASFREAGPLCSVEALACGTPAVVTEKNGLPFDASPPLLQYVKSTDRLALKQAIEAAACLNAKDRAACREIVTGLRWSKVAETILPIYVRLMQSSNTPKRAVIVPHL